MAPKSEKTVEEAVLEVLHRYPEVSAVLEEES